MKRHLFKTLLIVSALLAASWAWGQMQPPPSGEYFQPVPLETMRPELPNKISLSYRMGLNITADFNNLGGFRPASRPGPATGSAVDRTYDNGYNLVDISGNAGGLTWYWGYTDPNSIQDGSLVLSSSSSPAIASSKNNSEDPHHGIELIYNRELYRHERGWKFGLEGAFGYTPLSIQDNRTLSAGVIRVIDSFALPDGLVPPPAPYAGTFAGPGPVIGSAPDSRRLAYLPAGATITGGRTLNANLYGIRLGPYLEMPLNDRFSVLFGGGLCLVAGDTHLTFNETVTIPGVGARARSGSGWQNDFLVGGYVGASVEYALNEELGLFAGAQFQGAGRALHNDIYKQAILDLNESVVVSIGASYSF